MIRYILISIIIFLVVGFGGAYFYFLPNPQNIPEEIKKDVEIVLTNLNIPWELSFIAKDELLITQREGEVVHYNLNTKQRKIIHTFTEVNAQGEGGLLGMDLSPDFSKDRRVFFYITYKEGEKIKNKVDSYELNSDLKLVNKKNIVENIEGNFTHDGGRIEFGPDGYLYITTGDAQMPDASQITSNNIGKILRISKDGSVPKDNPFNNYVYSYGHRNAQGLAWDNNGNLWSTEHGPSGTEYGKDELNLITKGSNYGWPKITGDTKKAGLVSPKAQSGDKTWAPGQAMFYRDSIFFVGLRGAAIYKFSIDGTEIKDQKEFFKNTWGRLRALELGPDGYIYVTTSNTDGRGLKTDGDDKLIKINPEVFYK